MDKRLIQIRLEAELETALRVVAAKRQPRQSLGEIVSAILKEDAEIKAEMGK